MSKLPFTFRNRQRGLLFAFFLISFNCGNAFVSPFTSKKELRQNSGIDLESYLDSLSDFSPASLPNLSGLCLERQLPTNGDNEQLEYVPTLNLNHADAIVNAAIAVCRRNGFKPVVACVLDAGGSTMVMKRMDGCSPVGSAEFAFAKATSCIINKYPSRNFRDRYTAEPNQAAKFCQMTTMVAISGNKMAPFPGGILLMYAGHIVGAVGVSGAAGDEDEYCAIQGVLEANIAGLVTVPETHSCKTVKS